MAVEDTLYIVAVAIVESFKKESMYGLSAGTKKVAFVERLLC